MNFPKRQNRVKLFGVKGIDFSMSKFTFLALILIVTAAAFLSGCEASGASGFFAAPSKATIIVGKAQIRSSYSVVATDLLEVKRGEKLDILEEADYANEHWFRIRGHDSENTEGWIEARNVITDAVLAKSQALANEDKGVQSQATAQLKSASNLRLAPDLNPEGILFKLENGANFEVIGWKLVPKIREADDVDDAPKPGEQKNEKPKTARQLKKEEEAQEALDYRYDIWYKVRFDPSVSPAPAGWLFGRQVQLQVPPDIVHFQIGERKFVTWQRLDETDSDTKVNPRDKDAAAKETKAGSWVIFAHSGKAKGEDGNEPDFDSILVIGYDKFDQQHYPVYRSGEVWGKLPLQLEGVGDNKTFTAQIKNANGEMQEMKFIVFKDSAGHIKVTAPPEVPKYEKGK
jgi:hypothetical protein